MKALVTGISGQAGVYLTQLLSSKGYEIYGVERRKSDPQMDYRKKAIYDAARVKFVTGDITDPDGMRNLVKTIRPDEIYNLAAMSFVGTSWDVPVSTFDTNARAVVHLLEIIRQESPETKIVQCSTSEMFGKVLEVPQTEKTPFYPRSPYGVSKVAAHYAVVNYRESYGIHASSAIMFNYESKFRGPEFVTRKITLAAARIKLGLQKEIRLGNIETKRDWTHASDTVRAMWLMAQKETPSDYVISSGETRTVREFLDLAFSKLGLNYQDYIVIDPKFFRPAEVDLLKGNSEKAHKELGWYPKVSFEELVEEMVKADYDFVKKLET
jgi:GDPmannose 4,6-dehydratase